jgi:hypothetical protein
VLQSQVNPEIHEVHQLFIVYQLLLDSGHPFWSDKGAAVFALSSITDLMIRAVPPGDF